MFVGVILSLLWSRALVCWPRRRSLSASMKLSDRKPHEGVAAAHTMPVQGIDVSYWQGDIDWAKARAAGMRFAFIKATEGGDHLDPKFLENWKRAKNAGVARGAYHFVYWCRPAQRAGAVVHAERTAGPRRAAAGARSRVEQRLQDLPDKVSREAALEKIKIMLDAMEAHTGKQPIIYTDPAVPSRGARGRVHRLSFLAALGRRRAGRQIRGAPLGVLAVHHHRQSARASQARSTATAQWRRAPTGIAC